MKIVGIETFVVSFRRLFAKIEAEEDIDGCGKPRLEVHVKVCAAGGHDFGDF